VSHSATFPDLKGRSVFITGGGAGIGAALTEGFAAQGAKVVFVQRSDAAALCDTVEARHGARPLFLKCDVTDIAALKAAMAEAEAAHGAITVLVNNAANDWRHGVMDLDVPGFDATIAVNLRPHYFTAQAAVPGMRAAGGGGIVNYSSISFFNDTATTEIYTASKAAISGLTRGLARELGPDNIRVNALMPGWVLTDRQMELWASDAKLAAHLARQCLKQHLREADMVGPTLFLASDASRMMTGQALVVDGGVVVTG
jgi:NAD(P)-dependent dehydrogenase (short-subunit alcohol dehydrogenase family)